MHDLCNVRFLSWDENLPVKGSRYMCWGEQLLCLVSSSDPTSLVKTQLWRLFSLVWQDLLMPEIGFCLLHKILTYKNLI